MSVDEILRRENGDAGASTAHQPVSSRGGACAGMR